MPTPEFIVDLRRHIGHAPLWLIGSTAVILRDGRRGPEVLLVRRADSGEWAAVSGIVDPGEHPSVTARREAREEAGIVIAIERLVWTRVTNPIVYANKDRCQFLDHGFLARWVEGEATVNDEESLDVGWFPADALPTPRRRELDEMVRICLAEPGDVVFAL